MSLRGHVPRSVAGARPRRLLSQATELSLSGWRRSSDFWIRPGAELIQGTPRVASVSPGP